MVAEETLAGFFRKVADVLEDAESRPYGPEAEEQGARAAGEVLLGITGDRDKAIAAYEQLRHHFGGYMPYAAAWALVRASKAKDIIVPDAAPEVS